MAFKILLLLAALMVSGNAGVVPAPLVAAPFATSYAAHGVHHAVAAPVARLVAAPAPLLAAPVAAPLAAHVASPLIAPAVAPSFFHSPGFFLK